MFRITCTRSHKIASFDTKQIQNRVKTTICVATTRYCNRFV